MSLKRWPCDHHQSTHSRLVMLYVCIGTFFLLVLSCGNSESAQEEEIPVTVVQLQPRRIEVQHTDDIIMLTDSVIAPLLYSNIAGLDSLPLDLKKMKFVSALLPAILVAKDQLYHQRESFRELINRDKWTDEDSVFYKKVVSDYKSTDTTAILSGMQTHPNSIVLAQAAIESGWGNSRIFTEGNNLFGIWSYNRDEPRIPAAIKREGKTIYLRKYRDVSESISHYFRTLGRSRHYAKFRNKRSESDEVYELIPHLINYSERKEAYVAQLRTMIRYNQLKQYDRYRLDSTYYATVTLSKR